MCFSNRLSNEQWQKCWKACYWKKIGAACLGFRVGFVSYIRVCVWDLSLWVMRKSQNITYLLISHYYLIYVTFFYLITGKRNGLEGLLVKKTQCLACRMSCQESSPLNIRKFYRLYKKVSFAIKYQLYFVTCQLFCERVDHEDKDHVIGLVFDWIKKGAIHHGRC